jgi:hypothetical protein
MEHRSARCPLCAGFGLPVLPLVSPKSGRSFHIGSDTNFGCALGIALANARSACELSCFEQRNFDLSLALQLARKFDGDYRI